MEKFKTGYYTANTPHGVEFYDLLMGNPDAEILLPRDFINALDTLGDDEQIVTFLDASHEKIWNEIEKEYGIVV